MFTVLTDTIEVPRHQWEDTTRETGPDDFGRVVWARGEGFFFFHLCFISFLTMFKDPTGIVDIWRDLL